MMLMKLHLPKMKLYNTYSSFTKPFKSNTWNTSGNTIEEIVSIKAKYTYILALEQSLHLHRADQGLLCIIYINPFKPNGISRNYQLEQSISNFRGVG